MVEDRGELVQALLDDYIKMNQAGLVLQLCKKYYHHDVLMLSNGDVFARSMQQAYDKQKGYVGSVVEFDVTLLSRVVAGNVAELTFNYKMTSADASVNCYTGKHVQTWRGDKIIKEEYFSVD